MTDLEIALEFVQMVRRNNLGRFVFNSTTENSEVVLSTETYTLTFTFNSEDRLIAIAEW